MYEDSGYLLGEPGMEMVLEQPCQAYENDSYDLLDAERNSEADEDVAKSFMRLANTDKISVGVISDGSILIFCEGRNLDALNFFINEKSHEIYLYVQEKDEG